MQTDNSETLLCCKTIQNCFPEKKLFYSAEWVKFFDITVSELLISQSLSIT